MKWAKFKIILGNTFLDHECLCEKTLLLPTRVPPLFTSKCSKLALQPLKPVQPDLKPVQPVSGLFLCHLCSDLSDSQSCQKNRCRYFCETGSTGIFPGSPGFGSGQVSGWVDQWTEIFMVETGSTGFWLFSPNGCQLLGDPLNTPHTLSLHYFCSLHNFSADQTPNKGI
jgi:hypothetical protein